MIIIDQLEGQWAVLEMEDTLFKIPRSLLPTDVKEGDCLIINITLSPTQKKEREQNIQDLMNELFD